MNSKLNPVVRKLALAPTAFVFMLVGSCFVLAYTQEDGSRQIVLEQFTRARPAAGNAQPASARKGRKRTNAGAIKVNLARYRRVAGSAAKVLASNAELGITIWRLRPSRAEDDQGARLLVMQESEQTQWTPERVEANSHLKIGERVRISVESPRPGYLYVVDREKYADGSLGESYLIFPTTRTRGGDNLVKPGKLIDIPAQEDNPNYFTLVPSPGRNDQIGEVLTIIVTPRPLPISVTEKPLTIAGSQLSEWEKLWGAAFERFEMEGGAGLAWTAEEKEAAKAKTSRYLTQAAPTPQTIFRLAATAKSPLLVTVELTYRNR